MGLDLGAVMDAIGTHLGTISGLRVADYPAEYANPPQAIVSLPEEPIEYDSTAGRGADRCVIPVTILVGKVVERSARDTIVGYLSGAGAASVKAAVEAGDGSLGGAAQTVRVMTGRVAVITVQGADYLGAQFDVEVYD